MHEGQQIYASTLVGGKDYIPIPSTKHIFCWMRIQVHRNETDKLVMLGKRPTPLLKTYLQGQHKERDSKPGQDQCTFPSHLNLNEYPL